MFRSCPISAFLLAPVFCLLLPASSFSETSPGRRFALTANPSQREGAAVQDSLSWFQAESVDLVLKVADTNKAALADPAMLPIFQITDVTNAGTIYIAATGAIASASTSIVWHLPPDQTNLSNGWYRGFAFLVQTNGSGISNQVVLSRQNIHILASPDSRAFDVVGPLAFPWPDSGSAIDAPAREWLGDVSNRVTALETSAPSAVDLSAPLTNALNFAGNAATNVGSLWTAPRTNETYSYLWKIGIIPEWDETSDSPVLRFWSGYSDAYETPFDEWNSGILWHSGNFDPANYLPRAEYIAPTNFLWLVDYVPNTTTNAVTNGQASVAFGALTATSIAPNAIYLTGKQLLAGANVGWATKPNVSNFAVFAQSGNDITDALFTNLTGATHANQYSSNYTAGIAFSSGRTYTLEYDATFLAGTPALNRGFLVVYPLQTNGTARTDVFTDYIYRTGTVHHCVSFLATNDWRGYFTVGAQGTLQGDWVEYRLTNWSLYGSSPGFAKASDTWDFWKDMRVRGTVTVDRIVGPAEGDGSALSNLTDAVARTNAEAARIIANAALTNPPAAAPRYVYAGGQVTGAALPAGSLNASVVLPLVLWNARTVAEFSVWGYYATNAAVGATYATNFQFRLDPLSLQNAYGSDIWVPLTNLNPLTFSATTGSVAMFACRISNSWARPFTRLDNPPENYPMVKAYVKNSGPEAFTGYVFNVSVKALENP